MNPFTGDSIPSRIPPPVKAGSSWTRPPPFPPDPPDLNSSAFLAQFPPLTPSSSSPSSSSLPELQSPTAIEPENVVLALKAHHFSRPVIVTTQMAPLASLSSTTSTTTVTVNPNSSNLLPFFPMDSTPSSFLINSTETSKTPFVFTSSSSSSSIVPPPRSIVPNPPPHPTNTTIINIPPYPQPLLNYPPSQTTKLPQNPTKLPHQLYNLPL